MINDVYLKGEIFEDMQKFFTENGFIQLNDFLKENYKEFRENLLNQEMVSVYSPLIERKKYLNLKNVYNLEVLRLIEFFKSKEFLSFIENITEFDLNLASFKVNVYSHRDFILLNDKAKRDETISVIYDLSDQFSEDMGGTLTFTTKEEEIFYLEPSFNAVSIFYNPIEVMRYLKYINNKANDLKIIRIEMEFGLTEEI